MKIKKILLFIFCFVSLILASAQTPTFQWAKNIGDTLMDAGYSIVVDASGNVYTTGYFRGTADFDPGTGICNLTTSLGTRDMFISKLDASGNFVWAKNIGGLTSADNCGGVSIKVDALGNVYTIGNFSGNIDFNPGVGIYNLTAVGSNNNMFILKLDSNGNFVWVKNFGGPSYGDNCSSTSFSLDPSGNVYVTGSFSGNVDFDPGAGIVYLHSVDGSYDIFISKLDANGNLLWVKSIGGTSGDSGNSIALDASGNVYTTGNFQGVIDFDPGTGVFNIPYTLGNFDDIFILKLDTNGSFQWAKEIGGTSIDAGYSIAIDVSDNVYTTGFFKGTVDFDPGIGIFNLTSIGYNVFISKLDASGNFIWAKCTEGVSEKTGFSIAVDASGNTYTTGYFNGAADFDPGIGTDTLISAGYDDIFIFKLDSNGNFVWAKSIGGTLSDEGFSITLDVSGNIYTTGGFSGVVDFNPSVSSDSLTSIGSTDIFILKMGQPLGINETIHDKNIRIYPNPTNGASNLIISAPTNKVSIEIYNSIGLLVYKQKSSTQQNTIDLTNQANGLYFVKVMSDNKIIASQKIVKE